MTLNEKLQTIQAKLKANKGQYNSFGKYKYRSCEDILEAVKPIMASLKVALTINDDLLYIGNRYYIKATAMLRDCESNEVIENSAFAREEESKKGMDGSQVTGASSSYARKYALNGLFCIDDTKDSDATNQGDSNNEASNAGDEKIDTPKVNVILGELNRTGVTMDTICSTYKVKELKELTINQFIGLMKRFEKTPDKKVS